jgi:phage repressor protein C with HTH and peptisase S24 domain
MEPTLKAGQIVLASSLLRCRTGDVVVLAHNGLEKIKRIEKLENTRVFIVGDNPAASTDSRSFGWIPQSAVIARVIWPKLIHRTQRKI